MTQECINIGMLGAAKIGNWGLVQPCREIPGVRLQSVAARDIEKAKKYAKKHKIPQVHESYDAMLADDNIHAIYNPLPNSLHCEWSIKALEAGKHVLCEKPFANNETEALQMEEAAMTHGRVLMEACHYRYHPVANYMKESVAKLGHIDEIHCNMCVPLFSPGDIRYDYALGGGANMDVGAYTLNMMRLLASASGCYALQSLPEVTRIDTLLKKPDVDRASKAELEWSNGTKAFIHHSLWSKSFMNISIRVVGEHGELKVINPVLPHAFNWCSLTLRGKKKSQRIKGQKTYHYQMQEFIRRINHGATQAGDLNDAIDNMRMIDRFYQAANLPLRGL